MRSLLFLGADCILLMYVSSRAPCSSFIFFFFPRCLYIDTLHLGYSMDGWMSREQSVGQVMTPVDLHAAVKMQLGTKMIFAFSFICSHIMQQFGHFQFDSQHPCSLPCPSCSQNQEIDREAAICFFRATSL